jgi:hypothetical protein
MRFVYVLEDEPRFQADIARAILSLDPKIQVRIFTTFKEFFDGLQSIVTEGARALESLGKSSDTVEGFEPIRAGEAHTLNLVVIKLEFIGSENLHLLERTLSILIDKKVCTKEEPTAWVLTSFEKPDLKVSQLTKKFIRNLIFKPFDNLILTQHLIYAVDGHRVPSKFVIANQKAETSVEMLTHVELKAYSKVGALTESPRLLNSGAAAKYYSEIFAAKDRNFAMGIVRSSEAVPNRAETFKNFVQFYGLEPQQILALRKHASAFKGEFFAYVPAGMHGEALHAVMIGKEKTFDDLEKEWLKKISNSTVTRYNSLADLLVDLDPQASVSDRPKNLKFYNAGTEVTLEFNDGLNLFTGIAGDDKAKGLIANVTSELRKDQGAWFRKGISGRTATHLNKALTLLNKPMEPGFVLEWTDPLNPSNTFFLRILELKTADQGKVQIKLQELTSEQIVDWAKSNSKLKNRIHAIYLSATFIESRDAASLKALVSQFQLASAFPGRRPLVFVLATKSYPENIVLEWAQSTDDLFFDPLDKGYLFSKLQSFLPELKIKDEGLPGFQTSNLGMKAASSIVVTEFSEASFVMKYPREIPIGSFREFLLTPPYKLGESEILAQVNFNEASEGKKDEFKNHLVFFGAGDIFLKIIRRWILTSYVQSKDKG